MEIVTVSFPITKRPGLDNDLPDSIALRFDFARLSESFTRLRERFAARFGYPLNSFIVETTLYLSTLVYVRVNELGMSPEQAAENIPTSFEFQGVLFKLGSVENHIATELTVEEAIREVARNRRPGGILMSMIQAAVDLASTRPSPVEDPTKKETTLH